MRSPQEALRLSRRNFLRASGAALSGALLNACVAPTPPVAPPSPSTPTPPSTDSHFQVTQFCDTGRHASMGSERKHSDFLLVNLDRLAPEDIIGVSIDDDKAGETNFFHPPDRPKNAVMHVDGLEKGSVRKITIRQGPAKTKGDYYGNPVIFETTLHDPNQNC